MNKISSNVIPTVVENDIDTLKIKSNRVRRKNYNMFRDIDDEDDNIRPQIKRGNRTISIVKPTIFQLKNKIKICLIEV